MKNNNIISVKIIAGKYRGRNIITPSTDSLRPTSSRVRETLFNWLEPMIYNKKCLDLFAGSGVLGFEALSRGAGHVTFVDNKSVTIKSLKDNCLNLGINNAKIINCNYNKLCIDKFDFIFLDPPYSMIDISDLVDYVKRFSPKYIFLEEKTPFKNYFDKNTEIEMLKYKKAGNTYYGLLKLEL